MRLMREARGVGRSFLWGLALGALLALPTDLLTWAVSLPTTAHPLLQLLQL